MVKLSPAEKKYIKKQKQRFASKQNVQQRYLAVMGDGRGNLNVDDRNGFIYVTIDDNVATVLNQLVPNQAGTEVWVGKLHEKDSFMQVLSTASDSPNGAERGYLGYAPARRYEWHAKNGGQDPLYVHQRALTFLRLSVSDTEPLTFEVYVNVYRGRIWSGSAWIAVARQDVDVYAHIPTTAGKAAFVLFTINTSGAVVTTKGSEVDIDVLALTDIPAAPAGTAFICGAVRVYEGQIKVQEGRTNTDIVDLRFASSASLGGFSVWGYITGTLSDQTDLQAALDAKLDDSQLDTDITLAADSNTKIASQHAVKTYVDDVFAGTGVALILNEVAGGTKDGVNDDFTTTNVFTAGSLQVYLNGQLLTNGTDFTEVTSGFTMVTIIPISMDVLTCDYIKDVPLNLIETTPYSLDLQSISPTTADVTAAVNTRYLADLSGLTADRNFKLPAAATGSEIELVVTVGDDAYEFIVKGDTGVSINGGSAATEWSRVFISGEIVRFVADSGTSWRVIYDGRKPCVGMMRRITTSITTNAAGTEVVADWNEASLNVGSICDLTNNYFVIRRTAIYEINASLMPAAAVSDGKYVRVYVYKNSSKIGTNANRPGGATSLAFATIPSLRVSFSAGDTATYKFLTEEADKGLRASDDVGNENGSWFGIKEIL